MPNRFVVGDWNIDGDGLTASKGRTTNQLEPRGYQVLRFLAERPGRTVTIDELMDQLWSGAVVTPNAVSRVIAHLRKALEDDARNPHTIETVSRTGYRCVAAVSLVSDRSSRRRMTIGLAAATAATLLLTAVFFFERQSSPLPAVAVLPFENLTGDENLAYLADGVADELIATLTRSSGLTIRTRNHSFGYRDYDGDLAVIASELDARYLFVGSVRKSGEILRLTSQLVDPQSGANLWTATEEHNIRGTFDGQDRLSRGAAMALADITGVTIEVAPVSERYRPLPEAFDLYLRARQIWHRRGSVPLQPAIDQFVEAVRIDPDFAEAWAALAAAYLSFPTYSPAGGETWHLAEDAATKAIQLNPEIASAYGVLATFHQSRFEWQQAERLFLEGLRRNPRDATTNYWYGQYLTVVGKPRLGLEQYTKGARSRSDLPGGAVIGCVRISESSRCRASSIIVRRTMA